MRLPRGQVHLDFSEAERGELTKPMSASLAAKLLGERWDRTNGQFKATPKGPRLSLLATIGAIGCYLLGAPGLTNGARKDATRRERALG